MKKQNDSKTGSISARRRATLGVVPAIFVLLLAIFSSNPTFAREAAGSAVINKPEFKVGDRVEVDTLYSSSNPEKSMFWSKGTIVKMDDADERFGSYTVKLDKDSHLMTFRFIDTQWIRPLNETETRTANQNDKAETKTPPGAADRDRATATKNEPAANACQPSDKADNKTQNDIFKGLIISRYEHKSENDRDKTTTVSFQTFKLGATHKWRAGEGGESPDGPGGNPGTTIYSVKAVYTVCEDHPGFKPTGYTGEILTHQDDNTFYCFKNQFGEWVCNLGEGKTGKTKSTPKP